MKKWNVMNNFVLHVICFVNYILKSCYMHSSNINIFLQINRMIFPCITSQNSIPFILSKMNSILLVFSVCYNNLFYKTHFIPFHSFVLHLTLVLFQQVSEPERRRTPWKTFISVGIESNLMVLLHTWVWKYSGLRVMFCSVISIINPFNLVHSPSMHAWSVNLIEYNKNELISDHENPSHHGRFHIAGNISVKRYHQHHCKLCVLSTTDQAARRLAFPIEHVTEAFLLNFIDILMLLSPFL